MTNYFNLLNKKIDPLLDRIMNKINSTIVAAINKVKGEIQKENKTNIK